MNIISPNVWQRNPKTALCREGFGEGLVEEAKKNDKIVGLCCDLTDSTKMRQFADEFPKRFIEMGISEQNMIGVASGLALEGKIPVCASYAVFNPGRNWDQVRISVCYQNTNVKILGAHAGLSVGPDGATHQALEDIASLRAIPNITILAPCDCEETKKATIEMLKYKGPVYLRIPRETTPIITEKNTPFEIGKIQEFYRNDVPSPVGCNRGSVVIVATGPIIYEALLAAKVLAENDKENVIVLNCPTIKPLDEKNLLKFFASAKLVVTAEEHQVIGGLGGAIAELLSEKHPLPLIRIGVNDSFGESGTPEELAIKYGLTQQQIYKKIAGFIKNYSNYPN
ncbi:MAG: Uncharacterized protein CEN91_4 [Candidatus Berkelbacteria bacterium Licking1014_85]|uniref:Transketolase-like pyrimidine-binding domain-containing protein n=1 Tax=Candidatus Berkelbacteria bacterium Licking1014_85 TaxID=2017148 RepID=A0A554LMS6_9BACT|nr:MAG: Uncharacterized protein CEN91_4 [Candidatus Berkelbacteria bacterium Licking1014_85]